MEIRDNTTRWHLVYYYLAYIRAKTKKLYKHFEFAYFSSSYSLGIETINTFIHSRSSLKNHTRFQTKMGKVYTRFQTKTAPKPYPMRRPTTLRRVCSAWMTHAQSHASFTNWRRTKWRKTRRAILLFVLSTKTTKERFLLKLCQRNRN